MVHGRAIVIGALVVGGTLLAGCGGGDDGDSGGAGAEGGGDGSGLSTDGGGDDGSVTVVAEDTLSFDRDDYSVPVGEVTIDYENGGNIAHTLLIDGIDDFKLTVASSGDTDEGTTELEPGDYRIYCDVPGHGSMEATLTVE
jgi:cytochrome c oxidase subunit II